MLLVVVAGFAPTTFLRPLLEPGERAPYEKVLVVHGALSAAWMVLFIVQPLLVQTGKITQHRRLGTIGAGVASLVVIIGFWATLVAAGRPEGAALPAMGLRGVGMFGANLLMFGALVLLAIAFRHNGPFHKRLMFLGTVNMLQAPIVRITDMMSFAVITGPIKAHLLAYAFILPLVVWDVITLRRIHPATLWAGIAIVLSLLVRYLIVDTEAYRHIAQWLVDVA